MKTIDTSTISASFCRRAGAILRELQPAFIGQPAVSFYLAGGALTGTINDVDLFPKARNDLQFLGENRDTISETRNALTLKFDSWPVQVCNYFHTDINSLVDSFDFAHIQVGVEVTWTGFRFDIDDPYFTDAYIISRAAGSTWFTGSKYPLASMIRAGKYLKKGAMTNGNFIHCIVETLNEVVSRGFRDMDDFKDQLDAVDLGLVSEEMEEVNRSKFERLFELLSKSGAT